MTKYHSKKCQCLHGHIHDSKKEARRCNELHLQLKAGEITELEVQKPYVLIPAQSETIERYSDKTGRRLKDSIKTVERECLYYADFVYKNRDGATVVEDTKGMRTHEYIIKRKLMLYVHGIKISEV